jgi:hypothetical protein
MYLVFGMIAGALLATGVLLMSGNPTSAALALFLSSMIGAWLENAHPKAVRLRPRSPSVSRPS